MYEFKTNFLIRPPQGVEFHSVDDAGMPPCTICTVDIQTFRLQTFMHVQLANAKLTGTRNTAEARIFELGP